MSVVNNNKFLGAQLISTSSLLIKIVEDKNLLDSNYANFLYEEDTSSFVDNFKKNIFLNFIPFFEFPQIDSPIVKKKISFDFIFFNFIFFNFFFKNLPFWDK